MHGFGLRNWAARGSQYLLPDLLCLPWEACDGRLLCWVMLLMLFPVCGTAWFVARQQVREPAHSCFKFALAQVAKAHASQAAQY